MKPFHAIGGRLASALLFASLLASTLVPAGAQPSPASAALWPLSYNVTGGGTIVMYEPQVRTLSNYTTMAGSAAVAVTQPGATAPAFGVVDFTSLITANAKSDTVTFVNMHVDATRFPSVLPAASAPLDTFVRSNVSVVGHSLPLATVLSSLGLKTTVPKTVPVRTNPPTIFVSQVPVKPILVVFDGNPAMSPIAGTKLSYAVNTNWPVIRDDAAKHFYLLANKHWMTANAAAGPWTPVAAPAALAALPDDAPWTDARAMLHAKAQGAKAPHVYVSTRPAALIAFSGAPQFVDVAGTQLRYVSNTTSNVFFSRSTTVWYVLVSGRWFTAANLNGPWTFASSHLPKDFQKIPPASPKASVLASVPGTNAALFAAAAGSVPHLQPLDVANATLAVSYAPGAPQFTAIPGTPLQRAVNTNYDVVKVTDSEFYACHNAVWFTASSAMGPWKAATYVPAVIYTIPPSSPLYNDTYVYVYDEHGVPQTAPAAPKPRDTYFMTAASQVSNGDRAALYSGFSNGYAGAFPAQYGAYAFGTGFYNQGYWNAGIFYPYTVAYDQWKDTGFARQQELGSGQRAMYDPKVKKYARGATGDMAGDPRNAGAAAIVPVLHGSPTAVTPDNNVYAGPENVIYRNAGGAWQQYGANGQWSATPAAPPALLKDYTARVDGYNAQ